MAPNRIGSFLSWFCFVLLKQVLIQHTKKKVECPKEDSIRSVEESPSILEVEAEEVGRSSLLNESSDEQPVAKPAQKKKTSDEDSDDAFERCKSVAWHRLVKIDSD